jgi:hypothetical protein
MKKSYWTLVAVVIGIMLALLVNRGIPGYINNAPTPSPTVAPLLTSFNKINIINRQLLPPQPLTVTAKQGMPVDFIAQADEDGQIHFHSGENEQRHDLKKNQLDAFKMTFDKPGSYSIEFHPGLTGTQDPAPGAPSVAIGTIDVSPQ